MTRATPPRATVYVFLAPTCPISQAVTLELRTLHQQYAAQGVAFVGVFPDSTLKPAALAEFGREYQLKFPLRADPGHQLTRRLGAERVASEPGAVAHLLARCGRLPLALAVVAARAAARTDFALAELADELAGTGERLDVLSSNDTLLDARAKLTATV